MLGLFKTKKKEPEPKERITLDNNYDSIFIRGRFNNLSDKENYEKFREGLIDRIEIYFPDKRNLISLEKRIILNDLFDEYDPRITGFLAYNKDSPDSILIPHMHRLPVYREKDFENGNLPRGLIHIGKIVNTPFRYLTNDELFSAGFFDRESNKHKAFTHEESLLKLSNNPRFKGISLDSTVSYYCIADYIANPGTRDVENIFNFIGKD
ncbi:MAG TPA: hypothetical protein VEC16_02550 [Alphaproteobacteria bacterium]|nr:hypothetical protein [Alphaproteobacteria bacterium]